MPKTSNQSTSEAKDTSEIQLGLREQFPTCEPPDARLLKEGWKTYERNHSSEDPATLRLRATYRQLMGLHSTLANNNRSLTSKVARLEHMYETETYFTSSRAQAELRGVGGETGQYQQDLREFNQDVKQFLEQLSSDSSSLHRNTLKKNLEAEINTLSAFQSLDTSFNQAYSCFVEVYGQDVAIKHNLPNRVESLRGNSEIIQCNGDNLHEQRTQLRHRLKQTSSTHGLKHISDHIDYIKPRFEVHANQRKKLVGEIQDFIEFIDGLREDKDKALLDREKTETRKAELIGELQTYLDLELGSNEFKCLFSESKDEIGAQELAETGLDHNYEGILHGFIQAQGALQNVKSYAKMLHDEIIRADRLSWIERLDSTIAELRLQAEECKPNLTQIKNQISDFNGLLKKLNEKIEEATIEDQLCSARRRFEHCPRSLKVHDLVARTYGNVIKAFHGDARQPEWEKEFKQSRSNLHSLHDDDVVIDRERTRIEAMIESSATLEDLTQLQEEVSQYDELVKTHNCAIRSYQRQAGQFLQLLPGKQNAQGLREVHRSELSRVAKLLLEHVKEKPSPLFDALNTSQITNSDGRIISLTAEDRISVWAHLLTKRGELSINDVDKKGRGLVHAILLSSSMEPTEKASMIDAFADFDGDLNLEDSKGGLPLDLALRLGDTDPRVISTLQQRGAKLSILERIPLIAHLLGAGGNLRINTSAGPKDISLEGLSCTNAAFGLDSIFIETIGQVKSTADGGMKSALAGAQDAWRDTRSYDSFIGHMKKAQSGMDLVSAGPEMLMTGWDEPDGHAVGFVFNQEADGDFLYACNSGDVKEPRRNVVKYEVKDFDKLIRFFRSCSHNKNETRAFFSGKPSQWGLCRCADAQQLPDLIDEASQKRTNCPIASRKTCLVTMLWSSSLASGIESCVVMEHYKEVTARLRQHGVEQAIAEGNLILMGKALVKMLSKFDRSNCPELAYELANAILRQKKRDSTHTQDADTLTLADIHSKEFETTLRSALEVSHQWPLQERGPHGRTALEYAQAKGKTEAADILKRLSL